MNDHIRSMGNFLQRARNYLANRGKPGLFQVELTGRCNIDCTMCARSAGLTRPTIHMDLDLFKEIVDQSAYYKLPIGWFHHFGETLMYPHLREALAYFRKNGYGTGAVSTNAILLNENKRNILLENAKYILCCIDTMDPTAYQEIRNNPYFEKVRDNISKLIEERNKRGSDVEISVQFLRTSQNANEEISTMMDYFGHHPNLRYIEKGTVKHPNGKDIAIYSSTNIVDKRIGCGMMHSQLCVLCSGECVPCCWDADGEQVIGDVKTQSLAQIWQGKTHKRMQAEVDAGDFSDLPLCQKCAGPGEGDLARIVEQVNIYVDDWKSQQANVILAPDSDDMRWLINNTRLREIDPLLLRVADSPSSKLAGVRDIYQDGLANHLPGRLLIYSPNRATDTYFELRHFRDQGAEVVVIGSPLG